VIEEFMVGEEASFFVLCDGEHALPLATAQDHKAAFDGDKGPNTGGMGAYSPAPVMTDAMCKRVMDEMITPTLRALAAMGTPYKGVLFAGVMVTKDGPKLVEYNARFGDPECQVLMLRMKSDVLPALIACADGQLKHFDLRWYDDVAITVIMATKGYPGDYGKGSVIKGLDRAKSVDGVEIFHAGTKRADGDILANGGRVLNVCAMGKTVIEARARAYRAVDLIEWPEGFAAATSAGAQWSGRRADSFPLIASQRVRPKAGPMTGSAKQSSASKEELDCFVASLLAMTAVRP
jgi:phosphoribosylamine--glycine ligase